MGWFTSLFASAAAKPIEAVGNVIDKAFTSDEERLSKQALLNRIAQKPNLAQTEINKIEAGHRSIFIAGWRPFIGWICGLALFNQFILFPYISFFFDIQMPTETHKALINLVMAMLGLGFGTFRTIEKLTNKTK